MVIGIGALGGSGTRVVAELLRLSGIYIGNDLNDANDNLLFTRLFKNPEWFEKASKEQVFSRLQIFEKLMLNRNLNYQEVFDFKKACLNNPVFITDSFQNNTILIRNRLNRKRRDSKWAWKEPNTQFFLEYLSAYFITFKYIHVIRHGLDMAHSKNIQQLINWGYKFNITYSPYDSYETTVLKQLDFWIAANRSAINMGRKKLKKDFYLLNHSNLIENPNQEITKLLQFLEIEISEQKLLSLAKTPKRTKTVDRYKNSINVHFTEKQLSAVKEFGFKI
jgi:hypothetical protein